MNELNNFFLGVQQVAQDAVDKAPYDRTFRGVIEEINGDGTCNVRINGRTYNNIPCNDGLEVDEIVDVLIPQNNPSLMKVVTQYDLLHNGVNGFKIPEIQRGTYTVQNVYPDSNPMFSVTFPKKFSGTPTVLCGVVTSRPDLIFVGSSYNVDENGFTAYLYNKATGTYNIAVRWIAIN